MDTLREQGGQCLVDIEHIIRAFGRQDLIEGNLVLKQFTKHMLAWYAGYQEASSTLALGGFADAGRVQAAMETVLEAMEQRDYILLCDLLELTIKPLLYEVQSVSIRIDGWSCSYTRFAQNVELVRQQHPALCKQLGLSGLIDTETQREALYRNLMHTYVDTGQLEPTSSGYPTLALETQGKRCYMHSNVNPVTEAERMAETYYDIERDCYLVFGLGLGYLPAAMLALDEGIQLTVYEMNREIWMMALLAGQLQWLTCPRVSLVYDPDGTRLSAYIEEQVVPVLHRPSLELIRDAERREQLLQLSMRDMNVRHYQRLFKMNARENVRNCMDVVDVLQDTFSGRNAVIVAAGPSLSRNIAGLREMPEGTLVIAVGTTLKRLLDMGIRPDYVVFLDQNPSLQEQIAGIEEETVPALIAATAYRGIAKAYRGPKYLVCQRDNLYAAPVLRNQDCMRFASGGNVTTLALDICLQMGCREIALIGYDLAYTDGMTHDAGVGKQLASSQEDLLAVEGVSGDIVYTSRVFYGYKSWAERRVADLSPNRVIDATEGGAKKEGMPCMTLQAVRRRWTEQQAEMR